MRVEPLNKLICKGGTLTGAGKSQELLEREHPRKAAHRYCCKSKCKNVPGQKVQGKIWERRGKTQWRSPMG